MEKLLLSIRLKIYFGRLSVSNSGQPDSPTARRAFAVGSLRETLCTVSHRVACTAGDYSGLSQTQELPVCFTGTRFSRKPSKDPVLSLRHIALYPRIPVGRQLH